MLTACNYWRSTGMAGHEVTASWYGVRRRTVRGATITLGSLVFDNEVGAID